jgi:alpha-glucosidase
VVRPLWWRDQENAALWDVDDAFLCGDALLVAPVGAPGVTSREVTLPSGAWYDFWTNRVAVGARLRARPAPLETIPLFVRAGTVLPLGEIGPSVEQRPDKFLRLHVYPLTEDGEAVSWLYEDAGEGFGAQRVSRFVMRRAGDRLEVAWERDGDYHPPYEHIALTLNGLPRMPQAVLADGKPYRPVSDDPVLRTALVGLPPFEKLEIEL